MFKLNRQIKTKSGQTVVPFLVNGRDVHAFDKDKKVVYLTLDDFDFEKKKTKPRINTSKVVVVKGTPVERIDDPLFDPNESGGLGGVYEETTTVTPPPTPTTEPEQTTEINEEPIEIESDPEITFVSGSADTEFDGIPEVILTDTFEYDSFGKINMKVYSNHSHEVVEEETTGGYNYDDLYGM